MHFRRGMGLVRESAEYQKAHQSVDPSSRQVVIVGVCRKHPSGTTNALRFGGRYETGDYENELRVSLYHCLILIPTPKPRVSLCH
jgi:hypothetical protein